jgi:ADP-ribose pyrophosphatase YjhB (NUDIX family)
MHPASHFRHCPSCGISRIPELVQPVTCSACGFTLYLNTTCATAAFLVRPDGTVLFIRRAHEPAKGTLAIPGGFVDEGETAEDALRREFREEVGIEPGPLQFLCSHPNTYHYKRVTYPVLDFFFTARAGGDEQAMTLDGVAECHWLDPRTVNPAELAFPSMSFALQQFLALTPPG